MFKAMLIDDDVPMLSFLQQLLPWSELQVQLVESCSSSAKALKTFRSTRPHLIITDIGLPQMNGIELVAEMKKLDPQIRVIFLTCHEDFQYARQAIQMDADDYLIKDELTAAKLRESVGKSVKLLKDSADMREKWSSLVEIHRHKDVLKQSFVKRLLSGEYSDAVKDLGRSIGIAWNKPDYLLAAGWMDQADYVRHYALKDLALIRYAIYNIAEDLAKDIDPLTVFQDEAGHLMMVVNYENDLVCDQYDILERYLEAVRQASERYVKVATRFVISRPFREVQSLGTLHAQLEKYYADRFYEQSPIAVMRAWKPVEWKLSSKLAWQAKDSLLAAFRENNEETAKCVLRSFAEDARTSQVAPADWLKECIQLITLLEYEAGYRQQSELFYTCLLRSGSLQEAVQLMEDQIGLMMKAAGARSQAANQEPKLKLIENYIYEHLSENVTSITMANYLYLNPSYFSRYFKKLTQMNFTDYVHRLKMELAAQMIRSKSDTIEMIATKLGYSDRTYFSKVFKKYYQVSPNEYKH